MNGRSLSIISEALGGSNIDNCPHACLAKPCGPLAKCVPSLESYECKCNPQNEQCNKAEEIPINFIEQRMQLQQLGPVPNVVEADNEEDEEEEDMEERVLSSTVSTTVRAPEQTTSSRRERTKSTTTVIDYQNSSDDVRPTPFALPVKSAVEKDSSNDYYYAAYEDNDDDNDAPVLGQTPTLSSILNIPQIPPAKPSPTMKESIFEDSETTRWSSITRDGERVFLSDAQATPEKENQIADTKANGIWDEEDKSKTGSSGRSESNEDDDDDDDDDDYFEKEVEEESPPIESDENDNDDDDEDMDDDLEDFLRPFKIVLPPWREDKTLVPDEDVVVVARDNSEPSPFDNPNAADPFLKSREFLVDLDRIMKGKEADTEDDVTERRTEQQLTTSTSVRPEPTTRRTTPSSNGKKRGSCFTGTDSFFHYSDGDTMRRMAKYKLDINLRFKSHSSHGLLLWTGRHAARINDNFLLLGIDNG